MAMRQKPPTFRAQPPARSAYDDFQPQSKITENPDADILQIQLPGFAKERVKITYATPQKELRVTGERPIPNSYRWSRFNQSYSVPKDCEVDKIQGNFDQGVLTITMPKKSIRQIPSEEAKTSPEKPPSPSKKTLPPEPKPEKDTAIARDEDSIDKKTAFSTIPSPTKGPEKVEEETEPKPFLKPVPRRQIDDEKAQTVKEESEPRPMLKPAPGKKIEEIAQKGVDETREKIASTWVPRKQGDEEKERRDSEQIGQKPMLKPVERKDSDEMIQKGLDQIRQRITSTTLPRRQQEEGDDKNIERFVQKEGDKAAEPRKPAKKDAEEKSQLGLTKADQVPKTSEKEKEMIKKAGVEDKTKKEDGIVDEIGKGMKEVAASASQAAAKIAEGTLNEEEKRSLLNMGVAALVIAALGAYISFRFTAGKT